MTERIGTARGTLPPPDCFPPLHDIPARSRLLPTIPITSPQFVYRRAGETDLQATFARARAALSAGTPQPIGSTVDPSGGNASAANDH